MGLLDRLFGRDRGAEAPRGPGAGSPTPTPPPSGPVPPGRAGAPTDEQAIERYRYLLRTAPPDQVEQAHAEAFAQLSPDQRQQVLAQLAGAVPEGERPRSDDPQTLARAATRAEMRAPGTLERAFGGGGPTRGPGFGSMVGASMLGTIGGLVIGTAVADALFDGGLGDGGLSGGEDEVAAAESGDGFAGEDYGTGADGGDYGGGGLTGGDLGGGADFGGGDLGGF
jgi:hypothetical protein